jgi:hypothetical protein
LDAETKTMVSWQVGDRDAVSACLLMEDVQARVKTRMQLTTDGHGAYLSAVEGVFGVGIDYAQLVKHYGEEKGVSPEKRYSPAVCTGASKRAVSGTPDEKRVSTSYVERQNLNMRMGAPVYVADKRIFKEDRQSLSFAGALFFV